MKRRILLPLIALIIAITGVAATKSGLRIRGLNVYIIDCDGFCTLLFPNNTYFSLGGTNQAKINNELLYSNSNCTQPIYFKP
jgi:hypothetical protein